MYSHNTHLRTQFLTRQNYFQSESSKLTVLDLNLSIVITPPLIGSGVLCWACLSVCVSSCISQELYIHPYFTMLSAHAACGNVTLSSSGGVAMGLICTWGFVVDVTVTNQRRRKYNVYSKWLGRGSTGLWAESDVYVCLVLSRNETNINSRSHNRDDAHLICSRIISLHYSCLIDWFRSSDIFA